MCGIFFSKTIYFAIFYSQLFIKKILPLQKIGSIVQ